MSVTGGTIFSTEGTIAPPVNMLDEVLALNNIQHTSGSVNFPFHVEEPYNTTGVRKKKKNKNTDFAYAGGKNAKICARQMVCVRKETWIPNWRTYAKNLRTQR